MHRALALLALVAPLSVVACVAGSGDDGNDYETESVESADDTRADVALNALLHHYWDDGSGYFRDTHDYWIDAQAFDAVLDGAQRTDRKKYMGWIRRIYDGQDAIGWKRDFFDDENWMAMALIRAYDLSGDRRYLDRAAWLFGDIRRDATGHGSWGLCWDRSCGSKATASNAGPVITAVRLYERLHDASDLAFAQHVYAQWMEHMVDASTGAVTDSIVNGSSGGGWSDGARNHWKYTYNEGLVIGAAVALHEATHDDRYLADAHRVAGYMLAHETKESPLGRVLDDNGTACHNSCEAFKGIGYRYLLALYWADTTDTEVHDVLSASARTLWNEARGMDDLFGVSWVGPHPTTTPTLAEDASATMALNLYAILRAYDAAHEPGKPPPPPPPPPTPTCGRLHMDMTLKANETLSACDGRHRLVMQADGNFVLYDGGAPLWASHTQGTGADRATLQADGNLVVYDGKGHPRWASHTEGHSSVTLIVQDDGNLVLRAGSGKAIWATHTEGR